MGFRVSENVGNVIHAMKEFIENKKAVRIKEGKGGWEYAGSDFKSLVICLEENLINEGHNVVTLCKFLGNVLTEKKVRGCTIWHFFQGANIKNPTKGLILLSINGTAILSSFNLPIEHEHELSGKLQNARSEAVLVHCDLGISRSPTIIAAYLMRKYSAKRDNILAFIQSKQRVKPSTNSIRQLEVWEQVGYQVWEDEEKTIPKASYQAFLNDRAVILKSKGLTGNESLVPQNL